MSFLALSLSLQKIELEADKFACKVTVSSSLMERKVIK